MTGDPNYNDERGLIPYKALYNIIDESHIAQKKWKEKLAERKTTFSNAERFPSPKLNYTQEACELSLLDGDKNFHGSQPNRAHSWKTSTKRGYLFLDKD